MNKAKLNIMTTLQWRLNGKCSNTIDSCPKEIALTTLSSYPWNCQDCIEMFKGLVNLPDLLEKRMEADAKKPGFDFGYIESTKPCPCEFAKDVAIVRLNEYIKELEKEIKNAD